MMKRIRLAALAAASALLLAGSGHAVTFSYDFTGADHNSADWTLQGDAFWASDGALTPSDRLRLTDNLGGLKGSAWNNQAIDPTQDWTASFRYQTSVNFGAGADGLGFHIQTEGTGANTSFSGGGIVGDVLTVGVDTFLNAGDDSDYDLEVGLGGVAGSLGFISGPATFGCADGGGNTGGATTDCDQKIMRVDIAYDSVAQELTVTWVNESDSESSAATVFGVDLSAAISGPATFGFSGSTGASGENHDVLSFSGNIVPEPGTLLLLGSGLAGLAGLGRRKK